MIFKIAWRNIWRNKRRSAIVLMSIIVGLVAEILLDGLTNGMISQMLYNQINLNVAHIQIHKKGFNANKKVSEVLPEYLKVESILKNLEGLTHISPRVFTTGMINGKNNSVGVMIYGVDPLQEGNVSIIEDTIESGTFLKNKSDSAMPIVIGQKLSEKLSVKTGDKVSLLSTAENGKINSVEFTVEGIFKSPSSTYDKSAVYTTIPAARKFLHLGNNIHEIAIIASNFKDTEKIQKEISASLGEKYEVLTYREILPLLVYQLDIYEQLMLFMNLIVDVALIFLIINTMLMAVFERVREIGILMAIGMKSRKIYSMIVVEAFILGLFGGFIGLAVGLAIHVPLSYTGINLGLFSEGLESFGVGAMIYPTISIETTMETVLLMPLVAIIAALYPAYRATKLEPIESINYV